MFNITIDVENQSPYSYYFALLYFILNIMNSTIKCEQRHIYEQMPKVSYISLTPNSQCIFSPCVTHSKKYHPFSPSTSGSSSKRILGGI